MVPPARMRSAVDAAVASFELGELVDRRVDRMSMGQRQRLRIAMTFLAEPEVVLPVPKPVVEKKDWCGHFAATVDRFMKAAE